MAYNIEKTSSMFFTIVNFVKSRQFRYKSPVAEHFCVVVEPDLVDIEKGKYY